MGDSQIDYALFEHAVGYALFQIKSWEEIGMGVGSVSDAIDKVDVFSRLVKLTAFQPFNDAESALANANALSEGLLHADLEAFLANNFPAAGKKKKHLLAVGEKNIASQISEKFPQIGCVYSNPAPQYLRGIRIHFEKLVGKLSTHAIEKSQLSLGHSYSRSKVKFNVHRVDNMIIQSSALLDQLDKDINTFTMRLREWYSYHYPELIKLVPEATKYSKCVYIIKDRTKLIDDEGAKQQLRDLLDNDELVVSIVESARTSMGMDISEIDLINVEAFADRVSSLVQFRTELQEYLRGRMSDCAPNLAALVGEQVGARLISHAGSLTNLAKYPASTVQILGAEKALFRALKTRGNTPKYGLLYHSTFIGRAGAKNKGKISRFLANKCSIASRIDCFAETPVATFGQHLKQQVEDRLTYYETGKKPAKNLDVMREAATEAVDATEKAKKKARKRAKKEKKAAAADEAAADDTMNTTADEPSPPKKKKKSKGGDEESHVDPVVEMKMEVDEGTDKKKKKKKKSKGAAEEEE